MATHSENKNKPTGLTDKIIRMHEEGKTPPEIALECEVTAQTVRNHIHTYAGTTKRKYNRKILNCHTGSKFVPKEDSKLTMINQELKDTKIQLSKTKNLYKKSQSDNATLKTDILTLKSKLKQYEDRCRNYEEEYDKLIKRNNKTSTDIQRLKVEGLETQSLRSKIINKKFKELEEKNIFLSGIDKQGNVQKLPYSKFME